MYTYLRSYIGVVANPFPLTSNPKLVIAASYSFEPFNREDIKPGTESNRISWGALGFVVLVFQFLMSLNIPLHVKYTFYLFLPK